MEKEPGKNKERLMNLVFIIVTVILVVGGLFSVKYLKDRGNQSLAGIQITPASFDFGKISLAKGEVETSFEIKNNGRDDLVISGATTSCDCTSAKFKIGETESPIFGMHNNNSGDWRGRLKPGEAGQLIVLYNPQLHPVSGPVTRSVTIFTSGSTAGKTIMIEADVQP